MVILLFKCADNFTKAILNKTTQYLRVRTAKVCHVLACWAPGTILSALHESPPNNVFLLPVFLNQKLRQRDVRKLDKITVSEMRPGIPTQAVWLLRPSSDILSSRYIVKWIYFTLFFYHLKKESLLPEVLGNKGLLWHQSAPRKWMFRLLQYIPCSSQYFRWKFMLEGIAYFPDFSASIHSLELFYADSETTQKIPLICILCFLGNGFRAMRICRVQSYENM